MRLLLLLLFSSGALAQGVSGGERVEFPVGNEKIFGYLYRPVKPATAKAPAIIIIHGSGGVREAREGFWAVELAATGMAALVTDSFTPRGVDDTTADQSRVTQSQMVRDAYGALAYLAGLDFVDPGRVAVMGMSKGGSVALVTADQRTQRGGLAFAAHLPLYPGCVTQYRNPRTAAPVLMLIGADDNYTGVRTCADYAERMRSAGGRVEIKTYPGAHHGFDGDVMNQREFFLASAENYRDCVIYIEDDGRNVYAKTGEVLDTPRKAFETLRRDCVRKGATVAANHGAKMRALEDAKAFLRTNLTL